MDRTERPWDQRPLVGTCGQCSRCAKLRRIEEDAPDVFVCLMDASWGEAYEVGPSDATSTDECCNFEPVRRKGEEE